MCAPEPFLLLGCVGGAYAAVATWGAPGSMPTDGAARLVDWHPARREILLGGDRQQPFPDRAADGRFDEAISPLNRASKIIKPLLLVAGLNDPRVNCTEDRHRSATLRQDPMPVRYLLAGATTGIVQKYLPGEK